MLATRNQGKLAEMRALLTGVPARLLSLTDFPEIGSIPEEGDTYAANATAKALTTARLTGHPALADDSGLEVDALGAAPGVRSSRFLGEQATDAERNAAILERLRGVPPERRGARFRAVVAVALPDGSVRTFEGVVEGVIADAPSGAHGFGYDPIFLVPEQGRTMADLDPLTKNRISHRAGAMRAAEEYLRVLNSPESAARD